MISYLESEFVIQEQPGHSHTVNALDTQDKEKLYNLSFLFSPPRKYTNRLYYLCTFVKCQSQGPDMIIYPKIHGTQEKLKTLVVTNSKRIA